MIAWSGIATSTATPCTHCGHVEETLVAGDSTYSTAAWVACSRCLNRKHLAVYTPEPKERSMPERRPSNRHERRKAAKLARRRK